MKLICLNIWGGKTREPLMKFIREQAPSTDIFCFQEVFRSPRNDIQESNGTRIHLLDELAATLPNFNYIFHPVISGVDNSGTVDFNIEMGQAEFVKKSIQVLSSGEAPMNPGKESYSSAGNKFYFNPNHFGYIRVPYKNGVITVANVHGMTGSADNKLDNPNRLEQSRLIKEFGIREKGNVIICGDFNILPESESITTFSDSFTDLIKKYGISSTRSKTSPWHGTPGEFKFSDYIFVSPNIQISNFEVPDVEVSDHLPLIMEFS